MWIDDLVRYARSSYYQKKYDVPASSSLGGVYIRSKNFIIGENSYFNSGFVLNGETSVTIGNACCIGYNVSIISETHDPTDPKNGDKVSFPVVIGNNVWVGNNVVVLPGITIGDNTVIGANSVVTNNIPCNVVAAGAPCEVKYKK